MTSAERGYYRGNFRKEGVDMAAANLTEAARAVMSVQDRTEVDLNGREFVARDIVVVEGALWEGWGATEAFRSGVSILRIQHRGARQPTPGGQGEP